MRSFNQLTTELRPGRKPFMQYPRPQFKRDSYLPLNGRWDDGVIVPFPLQSVLSDYKGKDFEFHSYHKEFEIPAGFIKKRVILHVGAADCLAKVYINDVFVASHEGGYLPFSADITDALGTDPYGKLHVIRVDVTDTLDLKYPYGKQKKNRGGMWYTPVTGIWKSVWLESVPDKPIDSIEITPSLKDITLDIDSDAESFEIEISDSNGIVYSATHDEKYLHIDIKNPILWTVDDPHLYDITIRTETDEISSYFGLRTMEIAEIDGIPRILFNGKPFFFHGVLDQGYYPEGLFLPNSEEGYDEDIRLLKSLGFNTIRKHIKVEPECFYEACDRLGMIVFQDMVNSGKYHYFHDTIFPTLGFKHKDDDSKRFTSEAKYIFAKHMEDTIAHLYNHPCIVYYTIFNEGWGQFDSDMMYNIVKSMDMTRVIDSTSGWFKQELSDVESIHVYFGNFTIEPPVKRPVILSEFGGFTLKIDGHVFNPHKVYGYGACKSPEELTERIVKKYEEDVIPGIKQGLCGSIYTQITDVEDEINGLYTYDRKICKVDAAVMRDLAGRLTI